MNDFNRLLKISEENKKSLNDLYKNPDSDLVKKGLEICEFEGTSAQKIAILRRIVDLKPENLQSEFRKKGLDEKSIIKFNEKMYDYTASIHTNLHEKLIQKAKDEQILDEFYLALIEGVHTLGNVFNKMQIKWQRKVIDENFIHFSKIDKPYEFIQKHKLYQLTPNSNICERSYGVCEFDPNFDGEFKDEKSVKFIPYGEFFEEFDLENEFEKVIKNLLKFTNTREQKDYVRYFKRLKTAFCEKNNDKVIETWRNAEMAWMDIKSPLQVGHPLEYYEDIYTHAVALEWDIRLAQNSDFDEEKFKKQMKKTFKKAYKWDGSDNEIMRSLVLSNIDKTQLYISTPMIYYGAELNGLFSAQVVPNDEFVSANCGKKIFAFIDFVYESAKAKPFMKISSEIFEREFLDYTREILFKKEKIWKKVYEISTIGHEFGHMYFIDEDSEVLMNKNGVFKYIEEYKATTSGLVSFFLNESENMKKPVISELIKRSVGLIAWQRVDEVKAYYCEGLIHLDALFKSGVVRFDGKKILVYLSSKKYDNLKDEVLKNYGILIKTYSQKAEAGEFLRRFAKLENGVYMPVDEKSYEFVKYYYALYEQIGNDIDEKEQKAS
ncbi:MAG: invasion protein CiaB [Campylobacter sp.]|nr:invasion protein CiaB [Campylobacter sp.]